MNDRPGISQFLTEARGTFFREVDRERIADALGGSHAPGRYCRANQATLYLSASRAGVEAAMQAHRASQHERVVLPFEVEAFEILDLRDPEALALVCAQCGDPLDDWRGALERGDTPASWRARDWVEGAGVAGLIDPSRRAPGLWHLVLFRWNRPGAATVSPAEDAP